MDNEGTAVTEPVEAIVIDPNEAPEIEEATAIDREPVIIDTVAEPETVEEGQEPEILTMPATRQEVFEVGGTEMTLSLGEDGQISACINEVCVNIGEGDALFNSLNDLFAQLRQPE